MRALVTGGAGFVGQWLCRALLADGWEVSGAGPEAAPAHPLLSGEERRALRWLPMDVRRAADVGAALDAARPDAVFHLAGVSSVTGAAGDPGGTCEVNVAGAARLLGEVRARRRAGALDPAVVVVGSAEQYGRHDPAEMPLRETAEQRPLNVYAASKAAQEVVALEAFRADGVRVVATRSFNHSGAGQGERFLLPALVRRALALRGDCAGGRPALVVGNRETVRDFLHVADVARAYILLAAHGAPGEVYNVASGTGCRVADLAARVLRAAGVPGADVTTDPALVRAVEVPALVGDSDRLRRATGWAPTKTLDDIIDDLINAATH
ncbi:MAG: GDP-mannose 4,6-dehydratase [Gemmatimonadaceae bacterium]